MSTSRGRKIYTPLIPILDPITPFIEYENNKIENAGTPGADRQGRTKGKKDK
jgi:hypothetical protein